VRILSAANVNLERAVDRGAFREDLYHRLCVLTVTQPPLRERGADIELLAHHILDQYLPTDGHRQIRGFSVCAVGAMYRHSWPGNVRELVNRIRRALVMGDRRVITAADLELDQELGKSQGTLAQVRAAAEREAIERALMLHGDKPHRAARDLGISRASLYRLMANYESR
jgi:DNA-binding NtrC family response regulator